MLLDEHGEEIEYDLSVYHHGLKLSGLFDGSLSWRRLGVLVKHLPTESATKTAIRNATPLDALQTKVSDTNAAYGPWSQTDMLLAQLIDIASWLQWSKTKAAQDRPKDAPKPYPRPGVTRGAPAARKADATVINLLEYLRANGGAPPEGYVSA